MNKKLFLPLAMTLMLSSFSFAKDSQWSVCDYKNKNKFTLTVNMFEDKLTFISSQYPNQPLEMFDIIFQSRTTPGGSFTYSKISQPNIASVASYNGFIKNEKQTFYVFTYKNNDIGLGWEDPKSSTFFGKTSWCNQ